MSMTDVSCQQNYVPWHGMLCCWHAQYKSSLNLSKNISARWFTRNTTGRTWSTWHLSLSSKMCDLDAWTQTWTGFLLRVQVGFHGSRSSSVSPVPQVLVQNGCLHVSWTKFPLGAVGIATVLRQGSHTPQKHGSCEITQWLLRPSVVKQVVWLNRNPVCKVRTQFYHDANT